MADRRMLDRRLLDKARKVRREAALRVIAPLIGHQPAQRVGRGNGTARQVGTVGEARAAVGAAAGRKFLAAGGAGFSGGDTARIPAGVVYRLGWDFGAETDATAPRAWG